MYLQKFFGRKSCSKAFEGTFFLPKSNLNYIISSAIKLVSIVKFYKLLNIRNL